MLAVSVMTSGELLEMKLDNKLLAVSEISKLTELVIGRTLTA
jgi:hypothetical protein